MDRYFSRKSCTLQDSSSSNPIEGSCAKKSRINLNDLPTDPGLRSNISNYHPNDQDEIRRYYLQKGPCQPSNHDFPQSFIGTTPRRFCPSWFKDHKNWLEYSIEKDAVYCLCCYLFRSDTNSTAKGGGDAFVTEGFSAWNKKKRLYVHVGDHTSSHNKSWKMCEALMNQKQSIPTVFYNQSQKDKNDYRVRLGASVDCVRYLLCGGLPFRGHDESEDSISKGNFLELLKFLADHNESINKVVLGNTPKNNKISHSDIQKDIANAAACETTNAIIKDLDNDLFSILVDESRDISVKEQMAVVIRYVNKKGLVMERFLGIKHVVDTTALSLKAGIENLLSRHGLSLTKIRGQGYDGASNMRGELNGLKTLIMRENESAFYVHCFAHQLQLTLVAVAKNHTYVAEIFSVLTRLVNVAGGSCKRQDMLRETQSAKVVEALDNGDLQSGQGLNQETSLRRAGDTRWGSHYGTILNMILMFSSVIDVLEFVMEDALHPEQKGEALSLIKYVPTFEFVFGLHMMRKVLGITNDLSLALQKKNQDIVNAMTLVMVSKKNLQTLRDEGWGSLLSEVSSFCSKNDISVPIMEDIFVVPGRSRRNAPQITNLHHYHVELFCTIIDMQLQELNNRFTEANSKLLLCVTCLNPSGAFSAFDKQRLIELAMFYPVDFSPLQLMMLDDQLENYIVDVRSNNDFTELIGITDLSRKLVETKRDLIYPLVYLLVKLALLLPIATATVERAFSAMKYVKSRLCNRIGDQWLNDRLVTYIEKEVFNGIDNEAIMQRFQNMKPRRMQL